MQAIVATNTNTQVSASTAKKRSAPLDPKVADKLLELLSTDNEFRRLFKKDPQAALVQAGNKQLGPPQRVPPCLTVQRVAPKEEIAASREALKAYLTSGTVYTNPHAFEAGKVMSSVRRK